VYGRVLVEIAAVAPHQFKQIAPPVMIVMGVGALVSLAVWMMNRRVQAEMPEQNNPAELKAALIFGAMYAVVLVAVAAGQHYFSDRGLYLVAAISGLTDMDAITLSASRLAAEESVTPNTAWRAILIGTIANLVFKSGIVAVLGGRRLLMRIVVIFAIHAATALTLLMLWPGGGVGGSHG